MMITRLFSIFCLITYSFAFEKARFDNYRVYTLNISNKEQLDVIREIENLSNSYQFWKFAKNVGQSADIMVSPGKLDEFTNILNRYNFESNVMVQNVQKLIDSEQPKDKKQNSAFDWDSYHSLAEIYAWLDELIKNHPQVTGFSIGKSYENRDIRGIKISFKPGNPGIFLEANIHAREWVASGTATYVINELLTSKDPNVTKIANSIDWYIIPVLNVDGFVYSHEHNRMWRKTRQSHSSVCVGTDPNRNFDFHWMENEGASSNPCSDTYAGPKPFSEPETKSLADYVTSIKDKINIYLSFHTYGQWLLSPYGHSESEFPSNYNDMQTISKASVRALKEKYNTPYVHGSTGSVLYIATGTSPDWANGVLKTPLAYTFEFRDKGRYGFVLPAEQLKPNCEEALDGLVALVLEAEKLGYL